MTAKEQKIKDAWIAEIGEEEYNYIKDDINDNGYYLYFENLKELETRKYDEFSYCTHNRYKTKKRPKSLQGIENNNGWNRIDEVGLPSETDKYWVMRNGVIDVGTYSKGYGKWICSGQYYFASMEDLKITHYQPIIKPQPPIY